MTSFGALSSFTFTSLRSAGDTTWDQSDTIDLTTGYDGGIIVSGAVIAAAAASADQGKYVDVYLSRGPDTTRMSGGVAGGDAAYTGGITGDPAVIAAKNLEFMKRVSYGDSGSSATDFPVTFTVPGPLDGYVALVTFNSGAALSASTNVQFGYQTVRYSS